MASQAIINTFHLITLLLLVTACKSHKVFRSPKSSSPSVSQDVMESASNQTITNSSIVASSNSSSASSPTVDVSNYLSLLLLNNYYGQWALTGNNNSNNFQNFQNNNGILALDTQTSALPANTDSTTITEFRPRKLFSAEPIFPPHTQSSQPVTGSSNILQLLIKVYDGQYLDDQSLHVNYDLNSTGNMMFSAETATIYEDYPVSGITFEQPSGNEMTYDSCMLNISMTFLDLSTLTAYQGPFDSADSLGIMLAITSEDCNFSLQSQLLTRDGLYTQSEVIAYIVASCVTSVVQMIGVILIRRSFNKNAYLFNISPTSLFLTIALDYFVLLLNLIMVFSDTALLCIPLVFNVLLTVLLERDVIMTVFNSRSQRTTGRTLSDKDCKTCGCYFVVITIIFIVELVMILMYQLWVLYFTALVLVPQIIQNFHKERPYKFNYGHIVFMVIPKIAMIAYLRLYPNNIFRISPDPAFVAIYGSLVLVQIVILIIQTKYPRFSWETGKKYTNSRELGEDDVCPICMGNLVPNADVSPTFPRKKTIETTCTHSFHTQCLKKWLNKRTDCPMCRNNIADLLEEIDFSEEETRSPESRSPAIAHGESVYYSYDL